MPIKRPPRGRAGRRRLRGQPSVDRGQLTEDTRASNPGSVASPGGIELDTSVIPPVIFNSGDADPAQHFEDLNANSPLLLLPVRLETRYTGSVSTRKLKIRIYPDQIHLDDHQSRISEQEQTIAHQYWQSWYRAEDEDAKKTARNWLVSHLEARRAAWVTRQTQPEVERDGSLSFPALTVSEENSARQAKAACLPKRWAAVGYTRDNEQALQQRFIAWGKNIPEDVKLSVDPEDYDPWSTDDKALPVDSGMAWMVDYDTALDNGMAVTVDLGQLDDVARDGLALLLVVGMSEDSPEQGARAIAGLLEAHHYSDGLAFAPQGTPTNNTDQVDSGWSFRELDHEALLARELDDEALAVDANSNGKRLAAALGIKDDSLLCRLDNAIDDEESSAQAMNRVLWPVTWGQYFDHLLANKAGDKAVPEEAIRAANKLFIDHVRGGALLPAVRVANQPYGILPIRLSERKTQWTDNSFWLEETLLFFREKWVDSLSAVPTMDPVLGASGGSSSNDPDSVLVDILSSLPHPKRFLVRRLRDWREQSYDTEWAFLLALFGLVFLEVDDPINGYDALSVLGRWDWARFVLGDSTYNNIAESELQAIDDEGLRDADAQIDALNDLRRRLSTLVDADKLEGARAWIDYMIGQVEQHQSRQAPLNELDTAPIDFSGVLSADIDDPNISYCLYDEDDETKIWYRDLVESADAESGAYTDEYLAALKERVAGALEGTIDDSITTEPFIPRTLPGMRRQQRGGLSRTRHRRGITGPGRIDAGIVTEGPVSSSAGPGRIDADIATDGPISGIPDGIHTPTPMTDGLSSTFHNDEPLLYQLIDAVVDDIPQFEGTEYRSALETLRAVEAEQLELRLRETLGLASYRLDAWFTAMARQRHEEMREKKENGIQLGGFGWVLDLQPDTTGSAESQGFIHAPSLQQATTAAILRAGWSAHGTDQQASTLAVNLSGERVRLANWLLEGIRQGQALGDLLGYRFERALHDETLDQWIDPCRRGVLESQGITRAPRTGVDGLALAELYQANGLTSVLSDAQAQGDHSQLQAVLDSILEALDVVGDAGIAESIHYVAQGNTTRAAATLDAVSLGEVPPPELRHPHTPRAGTGITHRLAILLGDAEITESSWASVQPRATVETSLENWAAHMLGSPDQISCTVTMTDSDAAILGQQTVTMQDLGVCALDVVIEAPAGPVQENTVWARRVVAWMKDTITASAEATLSLDFETADSQAGQVSFNECAQLARALRSLLSRSRSLTATDLSVPDAPSASNIDIDELESRAATLESQWQDAINSFEDLMPAATEQDPQPIGDADMASLMRAMTALADFDFSSAIATTGWAGESQRTELYSEAWSLLARCHSRQADLTVLLDQWATADTTSSPEQAARLERAKARVQIILGRVFPLLPKFTTDLGHQVSNAFASSGRLLEGNTANASAWLQQVAKVRPEAALLEDVCSLSEMLTNSPRLILTVAQTPDDGSETWVARTAVSENNGQRLSWATVDYGGLASIANNKPVAGLMVDEWVERVPNSKQTTGVAFHFDAPASRAPQSLMVMVPPEEGEQWGLDLVLDTLRQTLESAQLRAVGPETLAAYGHHLPAIFSPKTLDPGRAANTESA